MQNANAVELEFEMTEEDFSFLQDIVYKRTGIVLGDHKRHMVYSRLARRLRALGADSFRVYCAMLTSGEHEDELGHMVNAITTNLSNFFREGHHFDHLREHVLLPLLARPPTDKRLRIWSAGCSWGAEPYSIALTVHDTMQAQAGWDIKILATDIDTNMLDRAQTGQFPAEHAEKIPPHLFAKYCQLSKRRGDDFFSISNAVKSLITFKALNLLEDWPMQGKFDAIFCRNVVIYFDKPTQTRLFERMGDRCKDNGWLYIGHSENLFKVTDRFAISGKTTYKKVS